MLVPNVFGAYDSRSLPVIRVGAGATEAQVMADLQRWSQFFSKAVDVYTSALSVPTTEATGVFGTGTAGGELQPYAEYGNTEGTNVEENEWAWGAPLRRWRDSQVYTEEYLAVASLEQIAKDTVAANNRSYTTRLKILLRALLNNVGYVWTERRFPGQNRPAPINVYPLFNADGSTARLYVNNAIISAGAIQSYVPTTVAGISKTNFTLGRSKLRDRGHTGRVVHVISPLDADAVKAMPGFVPIALPQSDVYARDPASNPATPIITRPEAIGTFSDGGSADGEVVAWPYFPQTYAFHYDATKEPPLVFRQHTDARFQGFRLVQNDTGAAYGAAALRNKVWEFTGGMAVRNRANGVVTQGTAGAYAVPSI